KPGADAKDAGGRAPSGGCAPGARERAPKARRYLREPGQHIDSEHAPAAIKGRHDDERTFAKGETKSETRCGMGVGTPPPPGGAHTGLGARRAASGQEPVLGPLLRHPGVWLGHDLKHAE